MKIQYNILFCMVVLGLFSCVSPKRIVYMQDVQSDTTVQSKAQSISLKPDDLLFIYVTALNPDVVKPFNPSVGVGAGVQTNDANTYLIDSKGNIDFPILGSIHLDGLTREQAQAHIRQLLTQYIKDPSVIIRIKNLKFSVLGDVGKPGVYTINGERATLLEGLSMAGDLNITGVRNNVLVIREENGKTQTHSVDLTKSDFMTSPVYYLLQNDVIYVQPNRSQIDSTSRTYRHVPIMISVTSLIITLATLLTR